MSNKYLEIAKQLKKGQSKKTNIKLIAAPFYGWDLIPSSNAAHTHVDEYDADGNYVNSLEATNTITKARKDKKKKPEVKPVMFTVEYREYFFLCFELSFRVVERVA